MAMKLDPYYRNFPSNVHPPRTPFSRSGTADAGHIFLYLTNSHRWSLLLDRSQRRFIIDEAQQIIQIGYNQLWIFEKLFSTRKARRRQPVSKAAFGYTFSQSAREELDRSKWPGKLIAVLREPYDFHTTSRDLLSYHLKVEEAIESAETYTRLKNRRAVVGLMLGDVYWH